MPQLDSTDGGVPVGSVAQARRLFATRPNRQHLPLRVVLRDPPPPLCQHVAERDVELNPERHTDDDESVIVIIDDRTRIAAA